MGVIINTPPKTGMFPDYGNVTPNVTVQITATTESTANDVYTASDDCYIGINATFRASGYSSNIVLLINDKLIYQFFPQELNQDLYFSKIWLPLKKGDKIKAFGSATSMSVYYITAPLR